MNLPIVRSIGLRLSWRARLLWGALVVGPLAARSAEDVGAPDPRPPHDFVRFRGGDRMRGSWRGGEDGHVRFQALHQPSGAAMDLDLASLAEIRFGARPAAAGASGGTDRIEMAGGGSLSGTFQALTAGEVRFDSAAAGPLSVPRAQVARIVRGADLATPLLEAPPFGAGWVQQPAGQNHVVVRDGAWETLAPATLQHQVDFPPRYEMAWDLTVLEAPVAFYARFQTAGPEARQPGNWLAIHGNQFTLNQGPGGGGVRTAGPGWQSPLPGQIGREFRVTLQVSQPDQTVRLLLNQELIGEQKMAVPFSDIQGDQVVLSGQGRGRYRIRNFVLRPWSGAVTSVQAREGRAPGQDQIRLADGNVLSGEVVAADPERIAFRASFGPLTIPWPNIGSVVLRGVGARAPARPSLTRIGLHPAGELAAEVVGFGPDSLRIRHPALGEVDLSLAALAWIQFPERPDDGR